MVYSGLTVARFTMYCFNEDRFAEIQFEAPAICSDQDVRRLAGVLLESFMHDAGCIGKTVHLIDRDTLRVIA